MQMNRFWHRGIAFACLGVLSVFVMTASSGCSRCCMRNGDGDKQSQAGYDKCGANCKKADAASSQKQAGFAGECVKAKASGCQGKSGCIGKAKSATAGTKASTGGAR